jgi:hypothetical protein
VPMRGRDRVLAVSVICFLNTGSLRPAEGPDGSCIVEDLVRGQHLPRPLDFHQLSSTSRHPMPQPQTKRSDGLGSQIKPGSMSGGVLDVPPSLPTA